MRRKTELSGSILLRWKKDLALDHVQRCPFIAPAKNKFMAISPCHRPAPIEASTLQELQRIP
jgi:hypothetical protein